MSPIIRQNRWFFTAFGLFIIIGGLLLLFIEQGDAIVFFSDNRNAFLNSFFFYVTKLGEEWAYVIALIFLLFIKIRWALLLPILGIILPIVSLSSKAFFAQPRPFLYYKMRGTLESIHLIDGVVMNGGHTSFPSGHTMSAFALYSLIAFCLAEKRWTGLTFFLLALLVGISRVYLVQHFLKDIYWGGILGVLVAMGIFYGQSKMKLFSREWMSVPLFRR